MPLIEQHIGVKGHQVPGGFMEDLDPTLNGVGPVGQFKRGFKSRNFVGLRRPFLDDQDRACVIVNTGETTLEKGRQVPIRRKKRIIDLLNAGLNIPHWILNATSLRKEEWIELDQRVITASRFPLVAWADVESANSVSGFNAYGRATYEYQAMSDPGEAVMDMDLLTDGPGSAPLFTLRSLPLYTTHSDFFYSDREVEISGNDGPGLDKLSAEAAAQRVSEMVEDVTIGNVTGMTYGTQTGGITAHEGTSRAYGFQNFTYRSTKTNLTTPTGANPQATVADVLSMIQTLKNNKFFGPYTLYTSLPWDQFLDNDYAFTNGSNWATNPSMTLRRRLQMIGSDNPDNPQTQGRIESVKTLPRWTAPLMSGGSAGLYAMILIDLKRAVRAVNGQPVTTLQWTSMGDMRHNFKVWCIQVPNMLAEYNQAAAEVHATTS